MNQFQFEFTPLPHPWRTFEQWTFDRVCWCKGDWAVVPKRVVHLGRRITMISLRHKEDLPLRPWDVFFDAKNMFIGDNAHAVEVYPPMAEIVDTSNTYHIIEVPFPLGLEYVQLEPVLASTKKGQ